MTSLHGTALKIAGNLIIVLRHAIQNFDHLF
jgi:hypothetical protein